MDLKSLKLIIYQILFTICVGLPYINNYELTFAVWFLILIVTITQKYSVYILKTVFPFILIVLIAAFSMLFYDYSIYNIIRDITYILKPFIGIIVGYQLCKNSGPKVIKTIINAGLLIAIIHLIIIFYSAIVHRIINIHLLREYGGYFSDYEIYVLIILLFHKQFQLDYSKNKIIFFILIIGFSSFLYVSRTNFIQIILFYLTLKGFFTLNVKSITVMIILFITSAIGYSALHNMNLSRNGRGIEALLYKIRNAPIEAFKTKINKDDYEDFNDNFRSYENITTIRQVSYEGWFAIVFGKGLGSTVDIGREMRTNDGTTVRYEAILHNGYMTVFLKAGLLGVILLIYSMYILMKHTKSNNPMVNQINLLLLATGIFLIFENWVLLGIFLKTESKSVLIGFIICYREILNKNKTLNE
jgi:hypothetical protein